jgi:hypothetical protein
MNLLTTPDLSHGLLELFNPAGLYDPRPTATRTWRWCAFPPG